MSWIKFITFSELDREDKLRESPLVLRHAEETKAPEFTTLFSDVVSEAQTV